MSASKAEKLRYWVTFLLDDLKAGQEFSVEALHLTVVPWFVTDEVDNKQLTASFLKNFANLPAFEIVVGPQKEMGGRGVSVNLVEPCDELLQLHTKALGWLDGLSARWALKNPYVGSDYRPHIRRRDNTVIQEGQHLRLTNLSLVKAARQEDWRRVVAARVELA